MELTESRLLVIGPNGIGKSNLLEAVELLGSLRSHRCSQDRDLIQWDRPLALLRADVGDGDRLELELRRRGGRQARRNGKVLDRQLDLIGPLRCIGFSALDLDLVRGEPALRRQWLDRVVLQLEPVYADLISRYTRLLRQRSQLWRSHRQNTAERSGLLDAFDVQMALISTRIHRRRRRALHRLEPIAQRWQSHLSSGKERLELRYQPGSRLDGEEAEEPWRLAIEEQLRNQREDEERLGNCRVGPHRDEINMVLGESPARRFGSAGQQRSLVLGLKLAELELVKELCGEPPLLLLDDVLAELDPIRQQLLLEAVGNDHQCLISATHLDGFHEGWRQEAQILGENELKEGMNVG
ncbi:RecF protein [Synechococcus sp. BL107]|nr:RecF protein [Synechococcus sp. BL107]